MSDHLAPLLHWVAAHPTWAGVAVMLIALSESLALIGLFLPGAMLMFGMGALVGMGALALWPTLAWAAAGAIAGDGISFWLGHHFHQRLQMMWPFRTHTQLLGRSVEFFDRHGGKSIAFARFIGPLRPIIPAVAGMMGMPLQVFLPVNIASGLLWAPVYILPGMVFGASLGLAAEVATRLALLLLLLAALVVAVVWAARRLFALLHPRAHGMVLRLLAWSRLHPILGRLPEGLLDPDRPEAKALTLWALLLVGATAAAITIAGKLGGGALLPNIDLFVARELRALHSPWADALVNRLGALGAPAAQGLLFVAVGTLLGLHRRRHALAHWFAAAGFVAAAAALLHLSGPVPPNRALGAVVLFGFLAIVAARELGDARRGLVYTAAAVLVSAVAFAQLFLGAATLSALLLQLTLGTAWVAALGIAYRRHPAPPLSAAALGAVAAATLLAAGAALPPQPLNLPPAAPARLLAATAWWGGGWRQLPEYRDDLRGRHRSPLNLQYAGSLERLRDTLERAGWHAPPPLTASSWLHWLGGGDRISALPLLPHVHAGRHETLLLVHPSASLRRLWTLRLWPAPYRVGPGKVPLWVGCVGEAVLARPLALLTVPRSGHRFAPALMQAARAVRGWPQQMARRADSTAVLLLRAPAGAPPSQ